MTEFSNQFCSRTIIAYEKHLAEGCVPVWSLKQALEESLPTTSENDRLEGEALPAHVRNAGL